MSVVRMNVTVPEDLARQMEKLIGPKKRSRFISEALRHRIEEIQREKLQKTLEEGYKARKAESQAMTREFEPTDLVGWDEY